MHVRMEAEIACPRVEYGGHTDLSTEAARVSAESLEGLGGGRQEEGVDPFWVLLRQGL
jgi:hypothetical protein